MSPEIPRERIKDAVECVWVAPILTYEPYTNPHPVDSSIFEVEDEAWPMLRQVLEMGRALETQPEE